jgi:hypothetical protein
MPFTVRQDVGAAEHAPEMQYGVLPPQATPQCPQLAASSIRFVSHPSAGSLSQLPQPVAHRIAQELPAQTAVPWVLLQTVPHPPQLEGSYRVSTQTPLQAVSGEAHEAAQTLPLQIFPAPQPFPQVPQLL